MCEQTPEVLAATVHGSSPVQPTSPIAPGQLVPDEEDHVRLHHISQCSGIYTNLLSGHLTRYPTKWIPPLVTILPHIALRLRRPF